MKRKVFVAGASVRAAFQSLCRAGCAPCGADLFADSDTREMGNVAKLRDYPHDALEAARLSGADAWMFVGGLENHPALVDRISEFLPLFGNRGDVLRRVRNLHELSRVLAGCALIPETRNDPPQVPQGRWLLKPRRSCGGIGMEEAVFGQGEQAVAESHFFQRRIQGGSASALYVAAEGRSVLLGVARQWAGSAWTGASGFQFCGGFAPLRIRDEVRHVLVEAGRRLAAEFRLTGLFGVDFIPNRDGVFVLEVNPRFTALAELFERLLARSVIAWHIDACVSGALPGAMPEIVEELLGKAIVYAPRDLLVEDLRTLGTDDIADLPSAGAEFRSGSPIATVFARGSSPQEVREGLRNRRDQVMSLTRAVRPS